MFPLGANTKAFTVVALAQQIDQRKLSCDERVADVLPGFRFGDSWVSEHITLRDLLTHRSGLAKGQGYLLFFPQSGYSRADITRRLRYLTPRNDFRSGFAFDNVLYIVAGEVLAKVSGKRWEEIVSQEIFAPLGMIDPAPNYGAIKSDNLGWPRRLDQCQWQRHDALLLCAIACRRAARVFGGVSTMVLVPDIGVGFAVLSNAEEHHALDAISYRLLDHYLRLPTRDWISAGKIVRDRQLAAVAQLVSTQRQATAAARSAWLASPSLPLANYAGVFGAEWYGTVTVTQSSSKELAIHLDASKGMKGPLVHVDHDTFRTQWQDPSIENAWVTFAVGPDRHIERVIMQAISPIADASFDYGDLSLTPVTPRK